MKDSVAREIMQNLSRSIDNKPSIDVLALKADLIDGKINPDQLPQNIGGGLSAYELAVQEGFIGTLEEWLISLEGADGLPGQDGQQGIQGIQGVQGEPGSDANVTKANVEAVLTGEITTHTHAGGGGGLSQQQVEGLI